MVARDCLGERGVRRAYLLGLRLLSGMMKAFWNLTEVVVAQYWKYTKCHWPVHLKMVNSVLCEFHTKKICFKKKTKDVSETSFLKKRKNRWLLNLSKAT